jgi:hypothetical protein
MQRRESTMAERLLKYQRLKRVEQMERPDPFVQKVFEVTFLGAVGTMIGMAAIGSMLGQ